MTMSTTRRAVITLAVGSVFGGALYVALNRDKVQMPAVPGLDQLKPVETVTLKGYISLDAEAYFNDERVVRRLASQGLRVEATRKGSRDMPGLLAAGSEPPDFFIPSGVTATSLVVEAARRRGLPVEQTTPFRSPLVLASWQPIARILVANGVASELGPKVYGVDTARLVELMLSRKRWQELKESSSYPVSRGVLVSSTDPRRSNSGVLYLALTSWAANHGEVAADRATGRKLALQVAELFKRQGYQENFVDGNFDDYTGIGIGKSPLAFVYEYQMVRYALKRSGIDADMVLMYPQPTIMDKEVFVSLNDRARKLGELLTGDAELVGLAAEHGFRINDTDRFIATVKPTGLALAPRVTQLIDPPATDVMTEMVDAVTKEMAQ